MADIEIPEAENKNLNRAVATIVVLFGTVMAITSVKDDNIVQAMQLGRTEVNNNWLEYQANRLKKQTAEVAVTNIDGLRAVAPKESLPRMAEFEKRLNEDIERYEVKSQELFKRAKEGEKKVETLSFRDDQFDISEALLAIALSIIGVAALIESWTLFLIGASAGGIGTLFSLAGFLGWNIYSSALAKMLT
ncbi:MAG: DUF4337 domain-containing protein [Aquabacterium sp.]